MEEINQVVGCFVDSMHNTHRAATEAALWSELEIVMVVYDLHDGNNCCQIVMLSQTHRSLN